MKRAILFFMLVMFAAAALAQTNTWTGVADTRWDNSDNWSLNRIPLITDNVVIQGATYQPVLTGGISANCYNITISGGAEMVIAGAILNVNQNVAIAGALWVTHADAVIKLGGNWTRSGLFSAGSGRVVFNDGNYFQDCSNETFNILEVNKPSGGNLRINSTTVICANYDWTAGGIEVTNGGTFTANKLHDNSIYGKYYLTHGSTINLHNVGGWVDLNGELIITGGEFNVYGGTLPSYWPYDGNAVINMSGGVLDFKDAGILIYNTPSYTLTENITGGTIRTRGGYSGNRADFAPSAGTFEFYGSEDFNISQTGGSTLHHVKINKSGRNAKEHENNNVIKNSGLTRTRANTIKLDSNVTITGNLDVSEGTLDLRSYALNVSGNANFSANVLFSSIFSEMHVNQHIFWFYGSSVNASQGLITLKGNWYFYYGCGIQLESGNLVRFTGSGIQDIVFYDDASYFGDVEMAQTGSSEVQISALSNHDAIISGNLFVPSGQTFTAQSSQNLKVEGELNLPGKLSILDSAAAIIEGEITFPATGWLHLNNGSFKSSFDSSGFHNLYGKITMNSGSTLDFAGRSVFIESTFVNEISGGLLRFGRGLFASSVGTFQMNSGTVEFYGDSPSTIRCINGNYLHNLRIIKNENYTEVYLDQNLTVKNDVAIISGNFKLVIYNLNVGRNWINNAVFNAGTGRVVFDGGNYDQICTNTTFNTLEINKPSGGNLVIDGTSVTCATYDWTAGGIEVKNGGLFTANDLADDGIYGSWYLSGESEINLTNSGGYVDLNGLLNISNGTFNVYGSSGHSYWPYASDASITMSGGVLDFHDVGIIIYHLGAHSLTENITGGTIRTSGDFEGYRSGFTPSGGTFEFYSPDDSIINQYNGCTLHNVVINKAVRGTEIAAKTIPVFDQRSGKMLSDGTRSNSILLHSDVTFSGNLTVQSGNFNLHLYKCVVLGTTEIFGNLTMNETNNDLTTEDIIWGMNSTADVSNGTFHAGSWRFDEGTVAKIGTGNTAYVRSIYFPTSNEGEFGNVVRLPSVRTIQQNEKNTYYPIRVMGDYTIKSGANSAFFESGSHLLVAGNSTIEAGATIRFLKANFITQGNLDLSGYLLIEDENQAIVYGQITFPATGWLHLTNGSLVNNYDSLGYQSLFGKITMDSSSLLEFGKVSVHVEDTFINEINGGILRFGKGLLASYAGTFQMNSGTVEFFGSVPSSIKCINGNYLNTLNILKDENYTEIYLADDLTVKNDVSIISGKFKPVIYNLNVGGNWLNNAVFEAGTGKVTFNGGYYSQTCTNTTFNTLEINKPAGGNVVIEATTVSCNPYDWTSGGIMVRNGGTFTAHSLLDNSIYGKYFLEEGGAINLHNSGWVDLNGELYISGGECNVYGGTLPSYWPFDGNAVINMSGGVLDFKETGILIYNTSTYSLTEHITGGVIRTAKGFEGARADFTPSAGIFEFYGSDTYGISQYNGCTLHHVVINKGVRGAEVAVKTSPVFDERSGKMLSDGTRSNSILLHSDVTFSGDLTVQSGDFNLHLYKCEVLGTTEIFGNLTMNESNNDLTAEDIIWGMNSTADVTNGTFHAGSWRFDEGTIAKIGTGNTAYVRSIYFPTSNEGEFGNVVRLPSAKTFEQNEKNTYYPIRVMGDYTIKSGANSAFFEPGSHLLVAGNSTIEAGASIRFLKANFITQGNLDLSGYLYVEDENQAIVYGDVAFPDTGWLELDNADFICYYDEPIGLNTLQGKITTNAGSQLEFWGRSIHIGADFVNEISHSSLKFGRTLNATLAPNFQLSNSSVEFVSSNTGHYVNFANGNFVHGFCVNKLYGNLALSSDILVTANVLLRNGTLIANDKTITIQGDWLNEAFPTGFDAGSGKVIFTGSDAQACSSENFNLLEINKAAEWFVNSSGAAISCQVYDWTNGGIWITDGSFTAIDLADDGLYGGFHVANGTIDLHQSSDGLIDINGSVHIGEGGTLNVHGGGYSSYWSFDGDAHIVMTSGVLDFKDRGIVLHQSPTYTLTTSITAGTIRTAGGFTGNRADFHPTGGTIELYGREDVLISHGVGSNFHQVVINKETRQRDSSISVASTDRFGNQLHKNNRANTVTLSSDIHLTGELSVTTGTLHVNGFELSANENVSVHSGGILYVNDDAQLLMAPNKNLIVNSFGMIKVLGSEGSQATISRTVSGLGGFYAFAIEADGVIMAEHAIFEYMDGSGIKLKAGSLVDDVHSFHSCTFRNGAANGTLLMIHNEQEFTVNQADFPENTWGGLFNVYKNVDSGVVHFEEAIGDFSGSSFEFDPYHRIHWGTLTAPANVTLQMIGNEVVISWDAVAGATSYKVYSADAPNEVFSLDGSGILSGRIWTAPIPAAKKFYRVTAIR
jgi:hypothetical protein